MAADQPWTRRERLVLCGLCLLAVGLRWIHVFGMAASPYFDAPVMDPLFHVEWARALAKGETFLEGPFFRAPLYPWFLGLVQSVFGESLLVPRLLQGLLGGLTTALVYGLGRQLFGRAVATVAGLLAATSWVLIYFDGELLIPALYVPLVLAGLLASLRLAAAPSAEARSRWAMGAGLVLGLAAIARPNVLLFMPFLALWIWRRGEARDARAALLFSVALMAPIAPISIYNRIAGGEWVLISSQAGVNLWIGNNPLSDGSTAIVPGTQGGWWEGFYGARDMARAEAGEPLSDAGISRHYTGKVLDWIAQEPGDFVGHLFWKLRLFWLDWELGNNQEIRFFANRFNPLSRISLPFSVLAGLGLVGAALAAARRGRESFPLWGFLLAYTASVVGFFVCSRFRVPVLPVLMVFAAHALVSLVQAVRKARWGQVLSLAGPALGLAIVSSMLPPALVSGDANGFGQLGSAEQIAGNHAQALECFELGLQADPNHPYLRFWMAQSLRVSGESERARRLLLETLEDHPDQPESLGALLDLEFEAQLYQQVIERAGAALQRNPGLVEARYHLGRAWLQLQDINKAMVAFRDVMQRDPRGFKAAFALGFCLEAMGDSKGALAAYENALRNADRATGDFAQQAQAKVLALRSSD
ncbi:MAG: tetratricopeptide (TPR) repeat protein [Planctomycetota bacterium]|jgi:tetratricopeptide (TPR) repeat protein